MPFQMVTFSCRRNFSRSAVTRVSHIYWRSAVHTTPLSLELLQCVLVKSSMQYRSSIDLESNHRSIPHSARIAHASNHLDMTIAVLKSLSAKLFEERTLAGQVLFQQEKPIYCSNGQPIQRYTWKEGEEG